MPIQVVCPGCKTRFNVSEKFAGQKGPCPKCKDVISIPQESAEVQIHAPEVSGPKDSRGRSVLKPIARSETKFSAASIAIALGVSLITVLAAFAIGHVFRDAAGGPPTLLLGIGLLIISPLLAAAGYQFLYDEELAHYQGTALWIRAGICGVVFAATWGAFMFVPPGYLGENTWAWLFLAVPFLAAGGLAALATLDLDFGSGVFLYCFYLVVTMLLRYGVGLEFIWSTATT